MKLIQTLEIEHEIRPGNPSNVPDHIFCALRETSDVDATIVLDWPERGERSTWRIKP